MPLEKEATLNNAETQEEVVDPRADVDQIRAYSQAKAIGELMANVQQLQGVVGK